MKLKFLLKIRILRIIHDVVGIKNLQNNEVEYLNHLLRSNNLYIQIQMFIAILKTFKTIKSQRETIQISRTNLPIPLTYRQANKTLKLNVS